MEHATIDITIKELIRITTALGYIYNDVKRSVPHADEYEKLRLKLHKHFAKHMRDD